MPRFFSGSAHDLGNVSLLPQTTFATLCAEVISVPTRLPLTREALFALTDPKEQGRAKRVPYVTPAEFKTSPSPRVSEHAARCNLIALDIDDAKEAGRLLTQRWADVMGDLGFIVWHTVRSTKEAPRLRVLVYANGIPTARYVAAARTVAEMIGMTSIDSKVTFHPVQPMFLPTVFADTPAEFSPIVASNPDGEAFTVGEIIADGDSVFEEVSGTVESSDSQIADISYLRQPLEDVALEDAADALKHLDPDMGMQQWIEVAAGLKHQFNNEEAYQLWDAWSAKGKKYVDAEETAHRWKSLKAAPVDRAPITLRSVFKQAQARGWSNPSLAKRRHLSTMDWLKSPNRSTEQLFDEGVKRIAVVGPLLGQLERKSLMVALQDALGGRGMKMPMPDIKRAVRDLELEAAKTTGIPLWLKGLCYVTATNVFYRHTTGRSFAPEVLDLVYSAPQIGEDKPPRPRDYAVQIATIPVVENLRYSPSRGEKRFFEEDRVPYLNTYRACYAPADPNGAERAGDLFKRQVCHLIAEPEYRRLFIDFFAYLVQHPGKKIRWAPVVQSVQGAGKTYFFKAMSEVLGRLNVGLVPPHVVIEDKQNDWAEGSQLVCLEEIRVVGSNRHAVMDKLKGPVADDFIPLRGMAKAVRKVHNETNYIMFTNYQDALAISDTDRRYFVVHSPMQTLADVADIGGDAWFDELYGDLRDNPGGLRAFLEAWTIGAEFKPDGRAPVTPYMHMLIENAASPLTAAVRETIADSEHPLVRGDILSLGCLRGALDSAHLADFSDQALAAVLREMGWHKFGRVSLEGGKHQLWTKAFEGDVKDEVARRIAL